MKDQNESKCPVNHSAENFLIDNSSSSNFKILDSSLNDSSNINNDEKSSCPVNHETRQIWLQKNNYIDGVEELGCSSKKMSDTLRYKTKVELSTDREISSIPRTGSESHWVYPSEKQFYEAMLRKKWNPDASDMKTIIPIHNSINERVWNYINLWEKGQGGNQCGGIKLTNFKGDAKSLTPRAWFRSAVLGYTKPFDRHDWTINRCDKEIEYVIDFYSEDTNLGPKIYLDVRPKLNNFEGFKMRIMKFLGLS